MHNALNFVGLAKKAGKLEIGEEPVGACCRSRKAKLVILASDAAENTVRRAQHFGEAGNVVCVSTPFTKSELGLAIGRSSCAMMALIDMGLAATLVEKLAAENAERYGEAAQQLRVKADKVLERQKEKRVHERRMKQNAAKPWAAPPKQSQKKT